MKLKQIETKTVHIFCFLCNNIQVTWQSPQRRKVQVLLERRLNEEREILTNDKSHVRHESRFPPLLRPQIQSPLPKTLVIWSIFSPFLDFSHSSLLLYLWFIISSKNVKSSLGLQLALSQSSFFKINSQYDPSYCYITIYVILSFDFFKKKLYIIKSIKYL